MITGLLREFGLQFADIPGFDIFHFPDSVPKVRHRVTIVQENNIWRKHQDNKSGMYR